MSNANKSVRTRNARRALREKYGHVTYSVVQALVQGRDPYQAVSWEVPTATVAATVANFTRGTYRSAVRNCNF